VFHASPTVRTYGINELPVRFRMTEKRDLVRDTNLILRCLTLGARGVTPPTPSASVDSQSARVGTSRVLPVPPGLADCQGVIILIWKYSVVEAVTFFRAKDRYDLG